MSDGTRIRYGLPRTASLMPIDLPPPGSFVSLSLLDHSEHSSGIGDLDADGVTLTMDLPPGGLHLPEGTPLGVAWSLRGMMCRMRVVRIGDAPSTTPSEFTVRIDEGPYLIERREFFRVDAECSVIIQRPGESWVATVANISRSGALVHATAALVVGEELDVTIDLGERSGGPLTCRATVIREATEHGSHAWGIKFIALPRDDDQRLVRFVAWQQSQV